MTLQDPKSREELRVQIAVAVFLKLIDRSWDREQKALEAVLLTEALLSALDPKR